VAEAHQHVDFLARLVHGAWRTVAGLCRAAFEQLVSRGPARELAPETMVVLVANLVAPPPRAIDAYEQHAALTVSMPRDERPAVLLGQHGRGRFRLAHHAPVMRRQ